MRGTTDDVEAGSVWANGIRLHYLAKGTGPLLLCLHGFPDHAHSFHHQLNYFSAAGYRVVAPFMREGFCRRVRPRRLTNPQTADLALDVVESVKALGVGRATLLGHDWGAHAAYGAAVLAPEMFDRIVTLAVPYGPVLREAFVTSPEQQKRSWYIFLFQTRLAEAAFAYDNYALAERLWA